MWSKKNKQQIITVETFIMIGGTFTAEFYDNTPWYRIIQADSDVY